MTVAEERPRLRPTWAAALVAVVAFAAYHVNPAMLHQIDSWPAPYVAWNLLHRGSFDISEFKDGMGPVVVETRDGRVISVYPPGSAIMALPFYAGLSLVADAPLDKPGMLRLGRTVGATYCALAAGLFYLTVRRLYPRGALLSAALFAFGTSVYSTASQSLWQHGPALFWVCLALWALTAHDGTLTRRRAATAGFALGMGLLCRPPLAIFLVAVAAWLAWTRRRRDLLAFALAGIPVAALLVVYNVVVTDNAVVGAYSAQLGAWSTPVWKGLAGLLVAPSRGVFIYTPALAIAVVGLVGPARNRASGRGPDAALVLALSTAAAGIALVYASYARWHGGWSYGPRYLNETMPVAALLFAAGYNSLASRWVRGVAVALVALSIAIHAAGVFANDQAWHSRHYVAPGCNDLFSIRDTQIASSVKRIARRAAPQFFEP